MPRKLMPHQEDKSRTKSIEEEKEEHERMIKEFLKKKKPSVTFEDEVPEKFHIEDEDYE
jgi:hypothetical protein